MKLEFPEVVFFYECLNDTLSMEEFEQWIQNDKVLESRLHPDLYIELISYNYKSRDAKKFIREKIQKWFDWQSFEKWRTINLLERILSGEIELVKATRKLKTIYDEQLETTQKPLISQELAIGYESLMDSVPLEDEYFLWNAEQLKKEIEPIELYRNSMLELVQLELTELINPALKKSRIEAESIKVGVPYQERKIGQAINKLNNTKIKYQTTVFIEQYKGTVIGLLFTIGSFFATWSIVVPIVSVFPASALFFFIFRNKSADFLLSNSIVALSIIFILTVLFYFWRIYTDVKKHYFITTRSISIFLLIQFFIVHPIGYFYYLSNDLNSASDAQAIFGVVESFPISSLAFVLLGVLIDLMRLMIGSRSK